MLDDDGCTRPLFGSSVQTSVVNRDRGTASEMLGELEIVLAVEAGGIGRHEHQPAEGSPGGRERNDHRRLHAELVEDLVVRRVLRG